MVGDNCVGGPAGPFSRLCDSDDRSAFRDLAAATAEMFVSSGCKHVTMLPVSAAGLLAVLVAMSRHCLDTRLQSRHCLVSDGPCLESAVDCLAEFKSCCLAGLLAVLAMSRHCLDIRLQSRPCLLSRLCLVSGVECLAEFKSCCLDDDADDDDDDDDDASDNMVTDSLTSSEHRLILRSMSS